MNIDSARTTLVVYRDIGAGEGTHTGVSASVQSDCQQDDKDPARGIGKEMAGHRLPLMLDDRTYSCESNVHPLARPVGPGSRRTCLVGPTGFERSRTDIRVDAPGSTVSPYGSLLRSLSPKSGPPVITPSPSLFP